MKTKKGKKWLLICLAVLIILVAVVAAIVILSGKDGQPPAAEQKLGVWQTVGEWTVTQVDGKDVLQVGNSGDAVAWNTKNELNDVWNVSVDMKLLESGDGTDCARLVFGDHYGNVCLAVSVEYQGTEQVLVKADMLRSTGWKSVYTMENWLTVDENAPLSLSVSRKSGSNVLVLKLVQSGNTLLEESTAKVVDRVLTTAFKAGLAVYDSQVEFSNFKVMSRPRAEDIQVDEEKEENKLTEIEVGQVVETDQWVMSDNVLHTLQDGVESVLIDGPDTHIAWNKATALEDEWTITLDVTFGRSNRDDGSVCSRYILGPKAEEDGKYTGLFTINYLNSKINLQMQARETDAWMYVGGTDGWSMITGNTIKVQIVKYKDLNRIAVFAFEKDRPIIKEISRELDDSIVDSFRCWGVTAYASQVMYNGFEIEHSADESTMPSLAEKVYPQVDELTLGKPESTDAWELGSESIFFTENGQGALCVDSRGENFAYYKEAALADNWSVSTRVNFGKYYTDVPGFRITLTDSNNSKLALLTVKLSPGENPRLLLQLESRQNNTWSNVIKDDWTDGANRCVIKLSGNTNGDFTLVISDADTGEILIEKTGSLPPELAAKISRVGLGTLCSQIKYTQIEIQP